MSTLRVDVIQTTDGTVTVPVVDLLLGVDISNSADPDKGASLVGFRQDNVNAVGSTVADRLRETTSVTDFGALGDGATANDTAFSNALAATSHLIIPAGNYRLSANATWPVGKLIEFQVGAKITVDAAKTITIRSVVKAGPTQIFAGSGVVVGLRYASPRWFGAVADGVTNDQPALQKAHDCIEQSPGSDGAETFLDLGVGNYGIASPLTLRPQQNVPLRVRGGGVTGNYGARLTTLASFVGTSAVVVAGQTGALAPIADFELDSFAVVKGGGAAFNGIQFGEINKSLSAVQLNSVKNIYVQGFNVGFRLAQTRLIKFERCSVWADTVNSSKSVVITVDANASPGFTGDLVFDDCQFVAEANNNKWCVEMISNNPNQLGIAGVKFNRCTFYHADRSFVINVAAGCGIADVWISDCQFDGGGTDAIRCEVTQAGAASYLSDFHIVNNYFQGFAGSPFLPLAAGNGSINNVIFTDNWVNGFQTGIFLQAVRGCIFNNNILRDFDITANAVVEFYGAANFTCVGNVLLRSATAACGYFISVQQPTANDIVIQGNTAGGIPTAGVVRDLTGAVRKSITGNI